jgi:hypothetical protein
MRFVRPRSATQLRPSRAWTRLEAQGSTLKRRRSAYVRKLDEESRKANAVDYLAKPRGAETRKTDICLQCYCSEANN